MSEAQIPKHDALINNGALSSPSSGSSGGYQKSVDWQPLPKRLKPQSPVEWCLQQLSKTLQALFSLASLCPTWTGGLGLRTKAAFVEIREGQPTARRSVCC